MTITTVKPNDNLIGDIDLDEDVDLTDWIIFKQYLLGNVELTAEQLKVADVDFDGDVDLTDWITLKQYLLGNVDIHA